MSNILTPVEIAETVMGSCCKKARLPAVPMIVLGFLAGAYIAFGAELSTIVTHDLAKYVGLGFTRFIAGSVFSVGLMLVIIAGGELFTGNCLIMGGVYNCRIALRSMLRNWFFVYFANFAGSLAVVGMMYYTGIWAIGNMGVGAAALKTAASKLDLTFGEAFFRGVGCNWLVCLAVWMAAAAKDTPGKILGIYFPVMAFVASGFEHSIANMYFIPMGILLKSNPGVVIAAGPEVTVDLVTWSNFFIRNLIPVTLGNIVGGALFVSGAYYLAYLRQGSVERKAPLEELVSETYSR